MFLAIQAIGPITRALNTFSQGPRRRSLMVQLPVMAVHWFQDIERISKGLITLKFNPDAVIQALRTSEPTPESQKIILMNSKWNIVWAKYCLAILETQFYPIIKYGFSNVLRFNSSFLDEFGESEPPYSEQLIERSGNMGADLIVGDLVANSYVDGFWGDLVDGLGSLTSFRTNYVQATKDPGFIDDDTALLAKSIALAEIAWSNEFFPIRDVSDMITFEGMWRVRFLTGMMDNFIRAANLVGAGLPKLSSREIIRMVGKNPGDPIEEVIK